MPDLKPLRVNTTVRTVMRAILASPGITTTELLPKDSALARIRTARAILKLDSAGWLDAEKQGHAHQLRPRFSAEWYEAKMTGGTS